MEELQEALRKKTEECDALQQSFDDFVESSKDLESEFEKSLASSEKDVKDKTNKLSIAEDKLKQLTEECGRLRKENASAQAELSALRAKVSTLEETKRSLENQSEDLSNQVRILEASEEDTKFKLAEAEEDIVFLNNDIEDLKAARLKWDEEHTHLKSQIEQLTTAQQQQEGKEVTGSYNSAMLADADATIAQLRGTVGALEATVKSLELQLSSVPVETQEVGQDPGVLAALKAELHDLQTDSTAKIAKAESTADQLRVSVSELQTAMESLELQLRAKTAEASREDELVAQLRRDFHLREAALQAKEKELQDLRSLLNVREALESLSPHPETDTDVEDESPAAELPGDIDFSAETLTFTQPAQSPVKLCTVSSLTKSLQPILESADIEVVRAELQRISERYESIRNSNTRLLNKLQLIRGNILVGCRTRPASDQELSMGGKVCVDADDDAELLFFDNRAWKSFAFDRVWKADSNQADVFADVEPLVCSVLDGYNSCIMAYGQTGSGKTHTMDGARDNHGVNYRALQTLFDGLQHRKSQALAAFRRTESNQQLAPCSTTAAASSSNLLKAAGSGKRTNSFANLATGKSGSNEFEFTNPLKRVLKEKDPPSAESFAEESMPTVVPQSEQDEDAVFRYRVEVSMMEIYNEQVYDLLHDSAGGGQTDGQSLDIRQSAEGVVSVPGLRALPVHNMDEARQVFARGTRNRATTSTNLNEHSSRSHLIIQVDVAIEQDTGLADVPAEAASTMGRMYLVDLAGSERIKKSGAVGSAMKEAQHINKSLLALGDVMEALDQKQKHVPYRNSKLTFLLQNALGGTARSMMIVTVCPTNLTCDESLFTLQFAQRVRNISLGPVQRTNLHTKNLELSLKALRAELKEANKKKAVLEDALGELKKEVKKIQEKCSSAYEGKLKALEEAKRASDVTVHHLQKQLAELTVKANDEKETRGHANSELELCQRNLKRALEQLKEHMAEHERSQATIRGKDRELESIRGALMRAYSASMSPAPGTAGAGDNTLTSPAATTAATERRSASTGRLSEGARVVFALDDSTTVPPKSVQTPPSALRAASPPKPALKHHPAALVVASPTSESEAASASKEKSGKKFFPPHFVTPTHGQSTMPGQRLSFFSAQAGTPHPRKDAPSVVSTPSAPPKPAAAASKTATSTPATKAASTPTVKPRTSLNGVPTPQRTSGLLQDPRPVSATRARPLNGGPSIVTNAATPSPSLVKRRAAASLAATAVPSARASLGAISEGVQHSTAAGAAITTGNVAAKMPQLSARSEEALRRHQLRMEKRREALVAQKT